MEIIAKFCYVTEKATLSNMDHCPIPFFSQRYRITDALINKMLITTTFCAFLFFQYACLLLVCIEFYGYFVWKLKFVFTEKRFFHKYVFF